MGVKYCSNIKCFPFGYFISLYQTVKMSDSPNNNSVTTENMDITDIAMNILLGVSMSASQWEQLWILAGLRLSQTRDKESGVEKNESRPDITPPPPPTPPTSSTSDDAEEEEQEENEEPRYPPTPPTRRVSFPDEMDSYECSEDEYASLDEVMPGLVDINTNNSLRDFYEAERDRMYIDQGNLYGLSHQALQQQRLIAEVTGPDSMSDGHISVFTSSSSEGSEDNWDVTDLPDLLNI